MPFAQPEGKFRQVIVYLEVLYQIGDNRFQIIGIAQEVGVSPRQVFGVTALGSERQTFKLSTIYTNFLVRNYNQRFFWYAFVDIGGNVTKDLR